MLVSAIPTLDALLFSIASPLERESPLVSPGGLVTSVSVLELENVHWPSPRGCWPRSSPREPPGCCLVYDLSSPPEYKPRDFQGLSVLLTAVSSVLPLGPGTWQALNTYLLKESGRNIRGSPFLLDSVIWPHIWKPPYCLLEQSALPATRLEAKKPGQRS